MTTKYLIPLSNVAMAIDMPPRPETQPGRNGEGGGRSYHG